MYNFIYTLLLYLGTSSVWITIYVFYIRFYYLVKCDTLGKIYKPPILNPYYDTNDSSDDRK